MVLYLSSVSAEDQMAKGTPEDMKKGMQPWVDWFAKCGSAIVDQGNPTGHAKWMGKASPTHVAGYTIMQANSIDDVIKMLEGHPHLMMGPEAGIEVNEIMPIM